MRTLAAFLIALTLGVTACGRAPSRLLRQGQLPINDFPIYLTEGAKGRLWKIDRDRTKTLVLEGLSDPRGVATDRFQNVYVAEYGAGRLLKVPAGKSEYVVLREGLLAPSVVAVDSFGEVYVAEDGAQDIIRASDGKQFAAYQSLPTALAFGVNDQPLVGLYNENKMLWGFEAASKSAEIAAPVNASIDGTGRVYVATGDPQNGKVTRYRQDASGTGTVVADNLLGPAGIAVDLVGNIFVVEQGANRVVLITFDGVKYSWVDAEDPQYIVFTQY